MKSILISKKRLHAAVFVLALAAVLAAALGMARMGASRTAAAPAAKRIPIYGVNTPEKKIALTFDCAWENSDTQILLDLLAQNNVPATLFATGDWCERYPDDVKAFAAAGHDIQNHSYAHPHVASISREALIADTQKCDAVIEGLTGVKPTLYRAPYGEYSDEMLEVFDKELGHKVIQWDCDSVDWKGREAADMVEAIDGKVRPGSILLFHNDTKNTPAALRQLIPLLKGEGYEFVLVRDLIYPDGYTLDHEGRQTKTSA